MDGARGPTRRRRRDSAGRRSRGADLLVAERRRHAARLPQRVRRLRRAARRRAAARAGRSPAPACERALRAPARRPLARRRRRCRSSRCRCCAARAACAWRSPVAGRAALVAGLRRFARGAARRAADPAAARASTASCARSSLAEDHRHLLDLEERRIVCVCPNCWSMRSGDASSGRRLAHAWLDDFELSDELWAAFQIPIGLAFFMRSRRPAGSSAVPEPGGRHRVRARPRAWDRARGGQPGARAARARRRGADRQPPARPAAYAIAPIDRCYRLVGIIKANWEGISGGARSRRRRRRFFDDLRAAARDERRAAARPRAARAGVHGARRRADRARGGAGVRFHLHAGEPEGREVYAIALPTQIHDRSGAAHLRRRDARAARRAVRPARALGRDDALVPVGARRVARAHFAARHTFTVEVPCTYDLEVASAKYFDALRDGEVPLSFHFNGTVLYRGGTTGCRSCSCRGAARPRWCMPVACGATDRRTTPPAAAGSGLQRETLERCRGARRGAGCTRSTTRWRTCSSECGVSDEGLEQLVAPAALRGLRALPVHARRNQERDADAVRHHLPAGLSRPAVRARSIARGWQLVWSPAERLRDRSHFLEGAASGGCGARGGGDGRVRLRRRAGPRAPRDDAVGGRAGAGSRSASRTRFRYRRCSSRRRTSVLAALHAPRRARPGRTLRLALSPARRPPRRCGVRPSEHLPVLATRTTLTRERRRGLAARA